MLAAVLRGPGRMEVEELPDPTLPEGGALLKMEACAVCGTDIKMLQQGHQDLIYPCIPGHELVGRIVQLDDSNGDYYYHDSNRPIREGDLVAEIKEDEGLKTYTLHPQELGLVGGDEKELQERRQTLRMV